MMIRRFFVFDFLLLNLRRLVFDQSSPVHPISESKGGTLSVTYERKSLCLLLDVKLGNSLKFKYSFVSIEKKNTALACGYLHPILDTRISVRSYVRVCVTLRVPPLDSETGWTGELWSNPVLLILEN